MTDGHRLYGYTVSSPCEPNGLGELKTGVSLDSGSRELCLYSKTNILILTVPSQWYIKRQCRCSFSLTTELFIAKSLNYCIILYEPHCKKTCFLHMWN